MEYFHSFSGFAVVVAAAMLKACSGQGNCYRFPWAGPPSLPFPTPALCALSWPLGQFKVSVLLSCTKKN